jgi:hypothetical protein
MANPAVSKAPTRNRNQFVRTRVSFAESVAAVVCVLLMAAIGVAIFIKGKYFDPARFMLKNEALKSTVADIEGKSGTIRGDAAQPRRVVKTDAVTAPVAAETQPAAEEGYESTAPAVAKSVKEREPLEIKVDGLRPMGDTEFYNADNLYEKIDGRAPAYLNFNFQQLRCRSFAVAGATGSFVDVYEYRFDTPVNAFGMFALERDPNGKLLAFAPDGYAGEQGFFFRQGACYVQVIASDQNAKTIALTGVIAENRAKNLPADDTGLEARRRLPATGLDPASVQFVAGNALGQESLKNVFQGRYDFDGAKLPFFVMVATPAEAAAAWTSLREFSGKFGGKVTALPDVNGARLFQAEGFGTWKIIYQRGGEIGGVFDADDAGKARQFVEQYLQRKVP